MTEILHTASPPVLHIAEGIATITLNRPAQRNRLENEDLQTLLSHFHQVNDDQTVRVVVLTANEAELPMTGATEARRGGWISRVWRFHEVNPMFPYKERT